MPTPEGHSTTAWPSECEPQSNSSLPAASDMSNVKTVKHRPAQLKKLINQNNIIYIQYVR
jgi:hypothetical protein